MVPALVELLKENKTNAQEVAIDCLKAYGAKAAVAIPMLEQLLTLKDRDVRDGAENALLEIRGAIQKGQN
jgi:HEAT repeat protein